MLHPCFVCSLIALTPTLPYLPRLPAGRALRLVMDSMPNDEAGPGMDGLPNDEAGGDDVGEVALAAAGLAGVIALGTDIAVVDAVGHAEVAMVIAGAAAYGAGVDQGPLGDVLRICGNATRFGVKLLQDANVEYELGWKARAAIDLGLEGVAKRSVAAREAAAVEEAAAAVAVEEAAAVEAAAVVAVEEVAEEAAVALAVEEAAEEAVAAEVAAAALATAKAAKAQAAADAAADAVATAAAAEALPLEEAANAEAEAAQRKARAQRIKEMYEDLQRRAAEEAADKEVRGALIDQATPPSQTGGQASAQEEGGWRPLANVRFREALGRLRRGEMRKVRGRARARKVAMCYRAYSTARLSSFACILWFHSLFRPCPLLSFHPLPASFGFILCPLLWFHPLPSPLVSSCPHLWFHPCTHPLPSSFGFILCPHPLVSSSGVVLWCRSLVSFLAHKGAC